MGMLLYMQMKTGGYSTTKESWQHQPLMHCVDVNVHPPTSGSGWGMSPWAPVFLQSHFFHKTFKQCDFAQHTMVTPHYPKFCPACHGHSPLPQILPSMPWSLPITPNFAQHATVTPHYPKFCPACHGHSPLPQIQRRISVYLRPTWANCSYVGQQI